MAELTSLQKLIQNPRKVRVLNLLDGSITDEKDDGAAVTPDGVFPNARRQGLLQKLGKFGRGYHNDKNRPKAQVYILAEPVAPLYAGDPVAAAPTLNDHWQKVLDANLKLRSEKLGGFVAAIVGDVKAIAKKKTDAANVGA